jgi:hypothetical protein
LFTMDAPCKRVFLEVQAGRRIWWRSHGGHQCHKLQHQCFTACYTAKAEHSEL